VIIALALRYTTFAMKRRESLLAAGLGLTLLFCAVAGAGHDLWAATAVHLAALGLWTALVVARGWPEDGPGISTALFAPAAAVAAVIALSSIHSVHPEESRLAALDWAASILFLLSAVELFRDDSKLKILDAVAAALLCFELVVVFEQHRRVAHLPDAPASGGALLRYMMGAQVPGTLVNASVATAFFLLFVPALLARARRGPTPWLVGGAVAVLGIISLKSTWGMLCLAASLPLLDGPAALKSRICARPKAAAAAAAVALTLLVAALAWKFGHSRNLNGDLLLPGETSRRLSWWFSGLRMFRDHPWLGVGIGNFPSAFRAYRVGVVQNTLYAHDAVITLLAETGVVGTGLILFLAASAARRYLKSSAAVEKRWPYALGVALFAAFGLVGLSIEYLANLGACAFLLGVAFAPTTSPTWKPRRSVVLVLVAATVCAVPWLLAPLQASRLCIAADSALAAGDAGTALRRYAAAAALDVKSVDAERGWARARALSGDLQEAVVHAKRASELDRLNPELVAELYELNQRAAGAVKMGPRAIH
jgi:O-antigen ligase